MIYILKECLYYIFYKNIKTAGCTFKFPQALSAIAHCELCIDLNVKILDILRILFNEFTARLNLVAHKN